MAADSIVDIVVNQKSSFQVTFHIKDGNVPLNLTGYTADAKLKSDFYSPENTAISFTTSIVNAANGSVSIALTPAQTANLEIKRYFYDMTITNSSGFKTRVVEGTVKVSGGVS